LNLEIDHHVRSQETAFSVIPAEAGIQECQEVLDPGVRRGDDFYGFLGEDQEYTREKRMNKKWGL
jgi:hypothetical protein